MLKHIPRHLTRSDPPRGPGRLLWLLVTLNVMAASWMTAAGDWLDRTSAVSSVVTLGGHSRVVLWLAVTAFLLLAGLAVTTGGFSQANRLERALLTVAAMISVVALAGILSVVGLIVGVVALVALLGGAWRPRR